MVRPAEFGRRSDHRVVVIRTDTDLLPAEADIVVIVGVGIRASGLEHIIITVVKRETTDEHVSVLVAVAVKTFDRRTDIAPESDAAIGVMGTLAATACAVSA